jgi:HEAT repeat protein
MDYKKIIKNRRNTLTFILILFFISTVIPTFSWGRLPDEPVGGSSQVMPQSSSQDWKKPEQTFNIEEFIIKYIIKPLIAALSSDDENVRKEAIEALSQLGKLAVEPLIQALSSDDGKVCIGAATALGRIGDLRAIEPLINALKDYSEAVRLASAEALAKIGEPAVEPLIQALNSDSWLVRSGAANALGKIGDPRAVEPLINALKDESWQVRLAAANALGSMGDPRAVEPLISALSDNNENVRLAAIAALTSIGEPAIGPLINALQDDNEDILEGAVDVLSRIGDPAIEPLLNAINIDVNINDNVNWKGWYRAIDALARIGDPAVEPLINALGYDNWVVRSGAIDALAKMGDPAVEPLINALSNGNAYIRRGAIEALAKIGDPRAVEPLIQVLNDNDLLIRSRAIEALGKIGDPRAVEPLIAALGSSDLDVCRKAEGALLNILGEEDLDFLKNRINNETNPVIQQNLENTLTILLERQETKIKIEQDFGIKIKDAPGARFSTTQLHQIYSILSNMPSELLNSLKGKEIIAIYDREAGFAGQYNTINKSITINLEDTDDPSWFNRVLFHEVAHSIDDSRFGFKAFEELFSKSTLDEDYAWDYGKTNSAEDFTTSVELYGANTKDQFIRAISQAKQGNPVYLEKLLFVLNVFTEDHSDYTIIYNNDVISNNGEITTQQLNVGRDSKGNITSIEGVGINDLDGLERLFSNIQF